MKSARILSHYLKRLSVSGAQNANANYCKLCRRLSILRGQIQIQTRKCSDVGLPFLTLSSPVRQRLSQWPLGLSYTNRILMSPTSPFLLSSGSIFNKPGMNNLLCAANSQGINSDDSSDNRKERFANRRFRERKEDIMRDFKETKDQMRQKMDDMIKKENIYTVPNLLCVFRMGMAPVLSYMVINQQYGPALGIFTLAGITDLLDGYIARVVPGQSSVLGSFLDPVADKILVATLFISLTYINLIPVMLTSLIIARDAVLIAAGFIIRYKSLERPRTMSKYFDFAHPSAQLKPTFISKVNTGIQLGLVGTTLLSTILPYDLSSVLPVLWWCTAATTTGSAISYVFAKNTIKLIRNPKIKVENGRQASKECNDANRK